MAKVPGKQANIPSPEGEPASQATLEGAVPAEGSQEDDSNSRSSRLFSAFLNVATLAFLIIMIGFFVLFVLVLDFLDLFQFRYKVPKAYREKWPLSKYYDLVRLQQMPNEDRLQELLFREKERYDRLITEGSDDLKKRAETLEASYRELVKSQQEYFRQKQDELRAMENELKREKERIEKLKADVSTRREAVDILSTQIASEAISMETSLIRFMEEENRLKPVQEFTAAMDPRAVATMFDEVTDSKLIFDILKGIPPERSALILSNMDPERAGKIVKMSMIPPSLPTGNTRPYIPSALKDLVASAQANVK